jgi:Arc/MetJ family transcription regulator
MERPVRTNIEIDDALIADAMAATGLKTKKAVVEEALRRLVRLKAEERTLALYGTVDWQGDLEDSRVGRGDAA